MSRFPDIAARIRLDISRVVVTGNYSELVKIELPE